MKFSRWIFITGTLFIIFALIFSCGFTAYAVKLDGLIGAPEWNGCRETVIFTNENESNCAVTWAYLRILEVPATNEIFFALQVVDKEFNFNYLNEESPYYGENSPTAVRLTVNGTELYIGLNGDTEYNMEPYHVSSFFLPDDSLSGYTAEIRVGIKLDFKSKNTYGLRLVDCMGEPSSLCTITIDNTPATVPEPVTTAAAAVEKPAATKSSSAKAPAASTTRRWIVKEKTTAPMTEPSTTAAAAETTTKLKSASAKVRSNEGEKTTVQAEQAEIVNINQTQAQQTQTATKYIIINASTENNDKGHMKTSHKIVLAACVLTFVGFGGYGYFLHKHKNPPVHAQAGNDLTDGELTETPPDEDDMMDFEESEDTDEQTD